MNWKDRVFGYWGLAVLVLWGAAILGLNLLRLDPYDIDETAARALLINWTVADRVVNPIITLGAPDFRALVFLPLGAYWPGSIVAVKVFMLLISFAAATLMYRWARERLDAETAMIATGLLLIAPLLLMQVNAVGAGPFLLLGFALGLWLDRRYRAAQRALGGWYFAQLLLVVTVVTLHPAGLAYPAALAWEWHRNPTAARLRKHMLLGVGLATLFALVFRFGWPALSFGINPLSTLADLPLGRIPGDPMPPSWGVGLVPAALTLAVVFFARRWLATDLLGRMLAGGIVFGLAAADHSWSLLVLTLLLYVGTWLLIHANSHIGHGFAGQRGLVLVVVFITATMFMIGDRGYRAALINSTLDPHDDIIRALVVETEDIKDSFNTASQWPAKTMLALKRPVFPLPPPAKDTHQFLQQMGKVSFIVFDPYDPHNKALRQTLSEAIGATETLIQQPEGVIVRIKPQIGTAGSNTSPAAPAAAGG